MPLVGSPMANRLWVTGQTKSGSRHLHEDHIIEARDVAWLQAETSSGGTRRRPPGLLLTGPGRAGTSLNERREAIPQWATCRGNYEGPCKEDWAADDGGDLGGPISRCLS
ncbi:hypothetical protein ILYODFUR_026512 [Ilyodon furcidens]|uniref:Uncharacterized protein n=1 Tax=Ilyodon furcidens TaxID=33524 RepID=A0ABV0UKT5_9TELE